MSYESPRNCRYFGRKSQRRSRSVTVREEVLGGSGAGWKSRLVLGATATGDTTGSSRFRPVCAIEGGLPSRFSARRRSSAELPTVR